MKKIKNFFWDILMSLFIYLVALRPLQVADLQRFLQDFEGFDAALPGVKKFVVLKALIGPKKHNKRVLAALVKKYGRNNIYCDAASRSELELALEYVPAKNIIFTNPNRTRDMWGAIKKANGGLKFLVIDSTCGMKELIKFARATGQKLNWAVRFSFKDVNSSFHMKFGIEGSDKEKLAKFSELVALAKTCPNLILVAGTCHVGTQNAYPEPFLSAFKFWEKFFKETEKAGIEVGTLDIGGGFPVAYTQDQTAEFQAMAAFCEPIVAELKWFQNKKIEVIAEPGRVVGSHFMTTFVSVSCVQQRANEWTWVYANSGPGYGVFTLSRIEEGAVNYDLILLEDWIKGDWQRLTPKKIIFAGPSCDGIDVKEKKIYASREVQVGDVLVTEITGSYTYAAQAPWFNPQLPVRLVFIPQWVKAFLDWLKN